MGAAKGATCPAEYTLRVIGGRWKILILYHLLEGGTLRFSGLRRALPGVTQKMLTQQLREMESDGIVSRKVYAEVPPRVEYSLTKDGQSLRPVVRSMCEWGRTTGRAVCAAADAAAGSSPTRK
jgi:DNA-binding HxlR family transcriptional regulator